MISIAFFISLQLPSLSIIIVPFFGDNKQEKPCQNRKFCAISHLVIVLKKWYNILKEQGKPPRIKQEAAVQVGEYYGKAADGNGGTNGNLEGRPKLHNKKGNKKMKYTMTVTIADPNTPKGMSSDLLFKIDCTFAYDPAQYGNGHILRMKKRGPEGFQNTIDLRYDKDFDRNNKPAYLEKWARSYWSGKDGAYYVKELRIEAAE